MPLVFILMKQPLAGIDGPLAPTPNHLGYWSGTHKALLTSLPKEMADMSFRTERINFCVCGIFGKCAAMKFLNRWLTTTTVYQDLITGMIRTQQYSVKSLLTITLAHLRQEEYPSPSYEKHPKDCSVTRYHGHEVLRTLIRCHFSPMESTGQQYIYSGSADGRIHVGTATTDDSNYVELSLDLVTGWPRRRNIGPNEELAHLLRPF
jgi:hypothetical protein